MLTGEEIREFRELNDLIDDCNSLKQAKLQPKQSH